MNQIVVDSPLGAKFQELVQPAEVVDAAGRRLGLFVPSRATGAPDDCPYSAEDLERMRGEPGGRTLPEIWKSLGAQ
jgi:hypothetical protein